MDASLRASSLLTVFRGASIGATVRSPETVRGRVTWWLQPDTRNVSYWPGNNPQSLLTTKLELLVHIRVKFKV